MRLRILTLLLLLIGLQTLVQAPPVQAQEGVVNKLLAPGPLIEGHKSLEHGDCLKCHDAGQGVPNGKCLACHTAIQKADKDSFHGRNVATKQCFSCHTDHKGRNFNSNQVNTKTFNHALTGFSLTGKHAKIQCTSCHTEKRGAKPVRKNETRFFGKDDSCKECHKKDDIHKFTGKLAAKECSACHGTVSWKTGTNFDHKKETGYALIGDHATLTCNKCHVKGGTPKYDFPELKSKQCLTCHADYHKDGLSPKFRGGNCDKCHTQTTWKLAGFDHAGTGFPLRGDHAKQSCAACHGPVKGKFTGLSQSCVSCHKDYHGFGKESGKQGPLTNCAQCHNESAWKPAPEFNHNSDTSYPITGKHKTVKCFQCHKLEPGQSAKNGTRDYEFPQLETKTCETCHKSPHTNSPAKVFKTTPCAGCHTTDGWKIMNKGTGGAGFNHNTMTKFALTGDHLQVSCDKCHKRGGKEIYKFPEFAEKEYCESCHKPAHKGNFSPKFEGQSCAECHNTTDFKNQSSFDHNKADFKLTGEHLKIAQQCTKCHVTINKKLTTNPPKPAHKFQFPSGEKGFCVDCHKNIHKDQFSSKIPTDSCQECHNTQSWKNLLTFDHDKTRFKIVGAHVKFKDTCVKCHVKTDKLLATTPPRPAGKFKFPAADKEFCEACHATPHKEQFEPKFVAKPCISCHTQISFDKRTTFDHAITDFGKLTGAHAALKENCSKCHTKTGNFLPTKPPKPAGKFIFDHDKTGYCEACHQSEHAGQFHVKFSEKPCRECHGVQAFEKRLPFNHKLARLDLKGKHLKLKCVECHEPTKEKFKAPPHHAKGQYIWDDLVSKDCATCHKDPHQGRFGKACSECHTESGWDATAEFHKNFQLSGIHFMIECNECHTDKRRLSGVGNDCKVCHQKDDIHQGTQPECATCHTQQFWAVSKFKHSMTSFPLRGAHRLLGCESCHAHGIYEGLDTNCQSCHFGDAQKIPSHQQPGFEDCDACHNAFSFEGAKAGN